MVDLNNVYVYLNDEMPAKQAEYVTPCLNGYTVYINAKLNHERQLQAFQHALKHIESGDFDVDRAEDVQAIEAQAHGLEPVKAKQFKEDVLAQLRKSRKSIQAKLRRRTARNKFLESMGVDMLALAESQRLDPDWR